MVYVMIIYEMSENGEQCLKLSRAQGNVCYVQLTVKTPRILISNDNLEITVYFHI